MCAWYVAFLRGINVGGNSIVKMSELRAALASDGFADVRTYIQSGNVLFTSHEQDTPTLGKQIRASVLRHFHLDTAVAVFSAAQWRVVMEQAPPWWNADPSWRHNLLILIPPCEPADVLAAVGELKADIERLQPGPGVLYQSIAIEEFGRSTGAKINRSPVYRQMTVRNSGTAANILSLLHAG